MQHLDEQPVDKRSGCRPHQRCNDGYPPPLPDVGALFTAVGEDNQENMTQFCAGTDYTYFAVFIDSHKDVPSPSGYGSEQTRCKVPGWVDGIAAVEPVGQPNGGDEQANKDWLHALLGLIVVHICDPKDAKEEEECAKELMEKRWGGGGGGAPNGREALNWGEGE